MKGSAFGALRQSPRGKHFVALGCNRGLLGVFAGVGKRRLAVPSRMRRSKPSICSAVQNDSEPNLIGLRRSSAEIIS